jgi:GTPase Era involved in 16S rRNA processing
MIAELVREAALEGVRDELPHSLAVQVEEMYPREGRSEDNPLWNVHVNLYVERPSQKAIIIGKRRQPPQGNRLGVPAAASNDSSARRSTSTCT